MSVLSITLEQRIKEILQVLNETRVSAAGLVHLHSAIRGPALVSRSRKVTDQMSITRTPAGIPEVLSAIEAVMNFSETAEFEALPVEERIKYFDQVAAVARVLKTQAMTEYIRRRWDGKVRWAYERPMTGSMKVSWSGVRAARKS